MCITYYTIALFCLPKYVVGTLRISHTRLDQTCPVTNLDTQVIQCEHWSQKKHCAVICFALPTYEFRQTMGFPFFFLHLYSFPFLLILVGGHCCHQRRGVFAVVQSVSRMSRKHMNGSPWNFVNRSVWGQRIIHSILVMIWIWDFCHQTIFIFFLFCYNFATNGGLISHLKSPWCRLKI